MALVIEETSKVTAKGQTTVPKAVRRTLGLRSGDPIAWRVDEKGAVSLARREAPGDEAAIDAFLAFLSEDIKRRPQAVAAMSEETANRLRALAEGVEFDLEDDLAGATTL